MAKRPLLADVAQAAGVSAMTVSNVVNGRPGVSDRTRRRVLEVAKALGYQPNLQARALAGGGSRLVGLISHDLTVQYAWELVRGVADELADAGYEMVISASYQDATRERDRIRFLTGGLTDGILLIAPVLEPEALDALISGRAPAVVIDPRRSLATQVTQVRAGNYEAARAATEHLLGLGHRRIGYIGGDATFDSAADRLRGYRDAVAAAGADGSPDLMVPGDFTQGSGFAGATTLLALDDRPTAVFAAADVTAIGALDAIKAHGLSVPGDVSVIGFDDIPQASQCHPALTTVRQPLVNMGSTAARLLLSRIRDEAQTVADVVLETELVVRHSTAAPRHLAGSLTAQAATATR